MLLCHCSPHPYSIAIFSPHLLKQSVKPLSGAARAVRAAATSSMLVPWPLLFGAPQSQVPSPPLCFVIASKLPSKGVSEAAGGGLRWLQSVMGITTAGAVL